ncbi:glycine/betaine ABC transporter permease [Holospora undulata]|nr:glycine/betaine ABC transporter permease [Holospora undulata]
MPQKLYRIVCHRSNPRSKEYMLDLLREKFPDAEIVDINQTRSPGKIILLYPDSIGLGWRKIESRLIHKHEVEVLNGRRRVFEFTPSVRRMLLLRRFLEMTFLPEILLTPFVLFYGAFVATKDKFRGFKS